MISNMIIPSGIAYGAYQYMNAKPMSKPSQRVTARRIPRAFPKSYPKLTGRPTSAPTRYMNRKPTYTKYKQYSKTAYTKSKPFIKRYATPYVNQYFKKNYPNAYRGYNTYKKVSKYYEN